LKLLLDHNLSHRLLTALEPCFPGSTQARLVGLERASDDTVWQYAKAHGLTIVTKDSDFHEFSLLLGPPPKVIWLQCGNTHTDYIRELLLKRREELDVFDQDAEAYCLELD